ncbi:winged helix-turn-helix domain-containing protein [Chelatococcus sp. SYSU_G07232]|uniref:Winged helix-turn-helix domain-containing protein n=1 Tax=Chelatococcus albus TaxID=3047466 RepID=A0ABT7ALA4_9HYPH|nr:winged helix-turn-helix domain-containing protein [Chelatococcus sp. SYSU_G07232]MDJ1160161.1 winged helix-turn-helix domain-containing protein [Chelatococcus sp. SYSU_G07232]
MATLSIRIDLDPQGRLGPGKIALLEAVAAHGSISAAGRAMGMSYKRAWELVAALNGLFREPLVAAHMGGRRGGGASLTPLGQAIVAHYRALEAEAAAAVAEHMAAIQAAAAPVTPAD